MAVLGGFADAGINNMRWCDKVRFPDAEGHHIVHGGGDVKVATDAGRAQVLHSFWIGSGSSMLSFSNVLYNLCIIVFRRYFITQQYPIADRKL